jgi:hypothetical protein
MRDGRQQGLASAVRSMFGRIKAEGLSPQVLHLQNVKNNKTWKSRSAYLEVHEIW